MKWLIASVFLVLSGTALADTRWTQVPGRPVWVAVPAEWAVAGSADRAALTATFPRGGVVTFVVTPAEGVDLATAREWDTLTAGYRGVTAPTIDGKGFHGRGRIGEALFALDVAQRPLDTSALTAVEPAVLLVVTAVPASVAKEVGAAVPVMVGSVKVQWERPGGEWSTVPGSKVELQEPLVGFQTSVSGGSVFVRARDGQVEVQALFRAKAENVARVLAEFQRGVDPGVFSWSQGPVSVPSLGVKKGALRSVGKGVVDGDTYVSEIVGVPMADGVLVVLRTAVGKAGAPPKAFPDLVATLRLTR